MSSDIQEGRAPYQCRSIEDVNNYFDRLQTVYESIRQDGFKSQQELGQNIKDEIRVHVTRNGEFCLGSKGNHRFRLAELTGVKLIPCILYGVNRTFIAELAKKTLLPPHKALFAWANRQLENQS